MDERADYTKAFVAFAVSGVFLLLAVLCLPTVIIGPQKFTSCFTISMLALLFGLAFMNGPANYVRKLASPKNAIASVTLFVSIVLSLYFSIISESYLLSLLFCFIEVSYFLFC